MGNHKGMWLRSSESSSLLPREEAVIARWVGLKSQLLVADWLQRRDCWGVPASAENFFWFKFFSGLSSPGVTCLYKPLNLWGKWSLESGNFMLVRPGLVKPEKHSESLVCTVKATLKLIPGTSYGLLHHLGYAWIWASLRPMCGTRLLDNGFWSSSFSF